MTEQTDVCVWIGDSDRREKERERERPGVRRRIGCRSNDCMWVEEMRHRFGKCLPGLMPE